eukprot:2845432-Rhodomonas_salina.1
MDIKNQTRVTPTTRHSAIALMKRFVAKADKNRDGLEKFVRTEHVPAHAGTLEDRWRDAIKRVSRDVLTRLIGTEPENVSEIALDVLFYHTVVTLETKIDQVDTLLALLNRQTWTARFEHLARAFATFTLDYLEARDAILAE